MRVGLEKEFFLLKDGKPQPLIDLGTYLPHDDCGWLVEARGKPYHSIIEAVFSLKADIYKIEKNLLNLNGYSLSDEPIMKIDRNIKLKCSRHFSKGLIKYQNLYNYESHRNSMSEATAGVHVSFTEEKSYRDNNNVEHNYSINFDWAKIFTKLDAAFAEEIKIAKRRPGFYELKPDGRIEYRSLPSNVNLNKLIDVLQNWPKCG